jgi:hypothetical protein
MLSVWIVLAVWVSYAANHNCNPRAGDELYAANSEYNLEPLVAENYGGRSANYYSVAVVPSSFCKTGTPTLASLKVRQTGASHACHACSRVVPDCHCMLQ